MSEKFTFFWGGPFSQWWASKFIIDDVTYCTAEQYMMASKARLFGDKNIEFMIMATENPKEQKALGRQIANFNADMWNAKAKDIVYAGNHAKFTQQRELKQMLLGTKGTTLVEASPYDKIWGIGLGANDPLALDRKTWKGTNWLGEVLTKVRDELCD